ncbi:MAG: DUF3179 domain-containing (seleno)protein [Candidatus Kariarchaeaceae archaeon]|jgi:hypothetical protein
MRIELKQILSLVFILVLILIPPIYSIYSQDDDNNIPSSNKEIRRTNNHLELNQLASPISNDLLECSTPNHPSRRRDDIPSIDKPKFVSIDSADSYIDDDDLIIGVQINDKVVGYPHKMLREHEVINDHSRTDGLAVTYCPLTGSGLIYSGDQLNKSEIGVTGILFENNLVFYDRQTDSCFSQFLSIGISGARRGQQLKYQPTIETTWETWKQLYQESEVLSIETGFPDSWYEDNPYALYETSTSTRYPSSFLTGAEPYNLFHPKMKTLVIEMNNQTYLFPYDELAKMPVSSHRIDNQEIIIVYDKSHNIAIPYLDQNYSFELFEMSSQKEKSFGLLTLQDGTNSIWNIKGETISGPNLGKQLTQAPNFYAYWFAASTFFPDAQIFVNNTFISYDLSFSGDNVYLPEDGFSDSLFLLGIILSVPIITLIIIYIIKRRKV